MSLFPSKAQLAAFFFFFLMLLCQCLCGRMARYKAAQGVWLSAAIGCQNWIWGFSASLDWIGGEMLERLRWFTQAIHQQASVQIDLFPDFVDVADELALGWEEGTKELLGVKTQLTPAQIKAFEDLDEYMASISGKDHLHFWTIDALNTSAEWRVMRNMAGDVLDQMNWPKTPPRLSNDIYIINRQ